MVIDFCEVAYEEYYYYSAYTINPSYKWYDRLLDGLGLN